MKNNPKISIIVPVYNAEKFIRECLDSLLRQSYENIEILCVNDGSKDSCPEILDSYAEKDNRVVVFHQENKGPAEARNLALRNASGEYLMFCDSDDTYEHNMCEEMYKAVAENNVDFAMCDANIIEFDNNHGRDRGTIDYHHLKYNGKVILTGWLKSRINVLLWNKIFKLSLIREKNINFPTGYECDDNAFIWQYLSCSNSFYGIQKKLYNYKLLSNSIMGSIYSGKKAVKVFDRIYATKYALESMGKDINNNLWMLIVIENGLHYALKHLNYRKRIKYLKESRNHLLPFFSDEDIRSFSLLRNLMKRKYRKVSNKIIPGKKHKLFGKVKTDNKIKKFFFGIPYLEKVKGRNHDKTYLFGLRINKKDKTNQLIAQRLEQIEHKFYYHDLYCKLKDPVNISDDKRYTVCFDCLYDKGQEAIDAYSVFQYLQENKIPSKYFVLKGSVLEKELGGAKDIIILNNMYELFHHTDILRASKTIITSFGCWNDLNKLLKSINYIDYVYIDHGVILLKKWVLEFYNPKYFDKILVPTKLTHDLYKKNDVWSEEKMIFGGLPRWDKLTDKGNGSIFMFFTWRRTFQNKPKLAKKYLEMVVRFIDKVAEAVGDNVQVEVAWHHELANNSVVLPHINKKNVKVVSTSSISRAIHDSSMLITDYSSVVWDYMCVNKPFVFYRFDKDELYLDEIDQLAISDAISEDDNLYNCFYDEEMAIKKIKEYANSNFLLEEQHIKHNKTIFYKQSNRCKDLIKSIEKKNG